MSRKAMSLKSKIRNLARKKDMSAQVVLQNYMFERFLERLSNSTYKNNFILKGGLLIAALVGVDNRATMDLDTTIKNFPLEPKIIIKVIKEICSIKLDDNVYFTFSNIESIRDDDSYGGYRVSIISEYDTIITPIHIDITTGDVITPKEVLSSIKMIFEENNIELWAYNVETVLAEKVETILRRGELNTRPRDFYDVYILIKNQLIDHQVFKEALKSTAIHRDTSYILNDMGKRINEIEKSESLKQRWKKYTKNYSYAKNIKYEDIINSLKNLSWKYSLK